MPSRGAVLVAIGSLVIAASGLAQQADPGPSKIAFVEVERAVALSQEGKLRLKELEDWAKPRQDELTKLGREVQQLQSDLNAKRGVASDDAVDEINRKLIAKQREFEDRQRIARRDFDERQNAVLRDLGTKLQKVISEFGDKNRYTAILMLKPDYVAYLANGVDLTETIIKLYDEQNPVAKPAAGK